MTLLRQLEDITLFSIEKPIRVRLCRYMVTVLRAHGLRVVIYVNDHEPAHVHVSR